MDIFLDFDEGKAIRLELFQRSFYKCLEAQGIFLFLAQIVGVGINIHYYGIEGASHLYPLE